ncbi:hypothetical protein HDU92_006335 [Lobulomyces angularis]|nr:hypothetical protein HDU92_006335 [Lobulomyces angularis]
MLLKISVLIALISNIQSVAVIEQTNVIGSPLIKSTAVEDSAIVEVFTTADTSPEASDEWETTHNNLRKQFGVPAVKQIPYLRDEAQIGANSMASTCDLNNIGNGYHAGMNRFWSTYKPAPADVVKNYFSGSKYWSNGDCRGNGNQKSSCMSFTAAAWKTTAYIGCASAQCKGSNNWVSMCVYNRPDNSEDSHDELEEEEKLESQKKLQQKDKKFSEFQTDLKNPLLNSKSNNFLEHFKGEDFFIEGTVVAFLVVYLALYLYGRFVNSVRANAWSDATRSIWEDQFSKVGVNDQMLLQDSPKDFLFFATGRNYVKDVYGYITCKPRHDLYSVLYDFFRSGYTHDFVTLNFNMDCECDNFIFALLPKLNSHLIVKSRYDLYEFTKAREVNSKFPKDQYQLYSDNQEFINHLFNDTQVLEVLWNSCGLDLDGNGSEYLSPLIESIIFTDQPKEKPEQPIDLEKPVSKVLQFKFRFPVIKQDSEKFKELMQKLTLLSLDVVDYIGQFGKLSFEIRDRVKRIRIAANSKIIKELEWIRKEELEKIKFKGKKEKQNAVSKLSPEEQKKFEEKERKKDSKKLEKKRLKKGKLVL